MSSKKYYSKALKLKILSDYKKSSLNLRQFSDLNGIPASTIHTWSKKLTSKNDSANSFLELKPQSDIYYEIISGKVSLRIPSTESASRLKELLEAMK